MFTARLISILALSLSSTAALAGPTICVWDPIGKGGQIFDAVKNFALAAQSKGVEITLKAFTDEKVAADEFRVGQCDGLMATSIRTRSYNNFTVALDHGGAATIVRDGKIDMDASYKVIQKAMQVLAAPGADKLNGGK